MSVKKKADFYSDKKYKVNLIDKFKGISTKKDALLDSLKKDLENGFTLYNKRNLERFLQCRDDINDFAEQFIILEEYYAKNNKYANSEQLYKILYGEILGSEKWKEKIEKVSGENNPWANHNGKYSPWKEGSENYSKESIQKAIEKRTPNTCLDYYLKKGYTEEESELLLKERQTTFSLDKCIEKHGEELGTQIWENRQEKWQNTLKSKSQEEIDNINKRKSSGIGRYLDRSITGNLYYIHFFTETEDFWKIGITSKNVNERFNFESLKYKHHLYHEILFFNEYDTIQQAYEEEQFILSKFNDKRIIIDIDGLYTTEAFSEDILKGFYDEII